MLITSSAAINCLQQFGINANGKVERLLKWLKWTCILLAVIIVLIAILLAGTIVSMVC
jgi:Na+-driven multidrug efflux pump